MAKEELIEFEGLVTEILPDTRYRVKLDTGHEIIAYTAGKMKKNRIKTLAGDRVIVEMSPYDLEKGRIIFRHKEERAASPPRPPNRLHGRRPLRGARSSAAAERPDQPGAAPCCAVPCWRTRSSMRMKLAPSVSSISGRCSSPASSIAVASMVESPSRRGSRRSRP